MALSYVINQLNKNILFKLLTSYFNYCIFVKEKLKHKNYESKNKGDIISEVKLECGIGFVHHL